MAHSRSALKRWRQSVAARDRNRSVKSRTRTLLTKALAAIDSTPNEAEADVRAAVSALDRAAQDGVIHLNAAARGKSRLLKRYNMAVAASVAAAASAPASASAPTEEAPRRRGRAASPPPAAPRTPRPRTPRS